MPSDTSDRSDARIPYSFELYPPRTDGSLVALHDTIQRLAATGPRFISVTYGAGGSTGGRSLEVLRYIREHTTVRPLAHLTCVGNSYSAANALIREFMDAGIDSYLAVRGDPPRGSSEVDPYLGDLESAAQLVQLIDRVQVEYAPYTEEPIPGMPKAALVGARPKVEIAVAAFPNGHPRSRHSGEHFDALLAKQAAGATLAITQLFFHPDEYFAFVGRCREVGIHIPIIPGVMPITSPARMRRVLELSGEEVPAELAIALEVEPTTEGQRQIGVDYAARLVRQLIAGGAPGIHLYAFNNHDTVLAVLREAGMVES